MIVFLVHLYMSKNLKSNTALPTAMSPVMHLCIKITKNPSIISSTEGKQSLFPIHSYLLNFSLQKQTEK